MTQTCRIVLTQIFILDFTSRRTAISTFCITIIAFIIYMLSITADLNACGRLKFVVSLAFTFTVSWDEFIYFVTDHAKLIPIDYLNSRTSYYIGAMKSCQVTIEA